MRFSRLSFAVLTLSLVASAAVAQSPLAITICPSPAPNAFGSPSYPGWRANALAALQTGGCATIGDRDLDPTAFVPYTLYYEPEHAMVTSFSSWRGRENSPAPFDDELGNRLHCPLRVRGDGSQQFTLADVDFAMSSNDGNVLGFTGTLAGTTLDGINRVGISFGPDRKPGTLDDEFYVSGESDAVLLDALYYRGPGNAYWPGGPGDPLNGQAAIDATVAYIVQNNVQITCSFTVLDDTASITLSLRGLLVDGFESGNLAAWSGGPEPDDLAFATVARRAVQPATVVTASPVE